MTDEVESQESSEQTGDTSVTEESAPQAESSDAEPQQAAPESKEEKPAPFHEHPRFKELIEQNRAFKEESAQRARDYESLQREFQSLRQQNTPKTETPIDPFLADLEKVNPEYAKSFKAVMEQAGMAKAVQDELNQMKQQQFAEKAYSHFNGLLTNNKVADEYKEVYQGVVEAEVYRREQRGEKLGLKDLDGIFNAFHAKYSKAMEERDRKLTASYSTAKKADTTPKGATGGAASTPGAKKIAAKDIAGQAKWLANEIRAMKKI